MREFQRATNQALPKTALLAGAVLSGSIGTATANVQSSFVSPSDARAPEVMGRQYFRLNAAQGSYLSVPVSSGSIDAEFRALAMALNAEQMQLSPDIAAITAADYFDYLD